MHDDNEKLPHQVGRGPVGKGVSAAVAAALSTAAGPLAPVVVGAFSTMEAFSDQLNATVARRDAVVFDSAATHAECTVEDAIEKIMGSDHLLILAGLAVDAARRTSMEDKAHLLGRTLGSILLDQATLDEESVWISIIARIEPPHLRLLAQFMLPPGHPANFDGQWKTATDRMIGEAGHDAKLGPLVRPLAQDLIQLGLLEVIPEVMQPVGRVDHRFAWTATTASARATPLAAELMIRGLLKV